ncbi:MAG: glycosyltransferase [Planctomycetota bacterium]
MSAGLRLGVGVCALNEEASLPRLLARLTEAGEVADRAAHVVVADGGSSDGTVRVAARFGAAVVPTARGRGVQLAAAAEALMAWQDAAGQGLDVLIFLHADAVPDPGALSALAARFAAGAEAAGFSQSVEGPGRALRWIERAADARVRRGMIYGDSGLALTPAAYRRAGGFEPLPLFEDVALSHALRRAGVRAQLVEGARLRVSARRWQREGILRCTLRNWMLRGLYELGVSPLRLARSYRPHSSP